MRIKRIIILLLVIIALILSVSCNSSYESDGSDIDVVPVTATDEEKDSISPDSDDELIVEDIHSLIYLRDGNTKHLVGFELGDEFDYNIFEIAGSWGDTIYRIKNSGYDSVQFYFSGKGNRFSGLVASFGDDFFGIKPSEDSLKKIVNILGEPDDYQENVETDGDSFATYYFEKAALHVCVDTNGIIRYIKYIASDDIFNDNYLSEGNTEYIEDLQSSHGYAETIYSWVFNQDEAHYHPYEEFYEEDKKAAFIKNYLQERGMYKDTPDGVTYDEQGDLLAEYYIDKENNKLCFVIHLWGNYWLDYEAGISDYTDAIYCATLYLDESSKAGNLISEYDTEQNITRERLYDAQGKRMADISYEYIPGTLFPFVTDHWNIDAGFELIDAALCRNQKTWFYKEQAQFNESGRFIGYNGSISQKDYREYFPYPCICVYDTNGRLDAIQEELLEYDIEEGWGWWDESINYSGQIKFGYHENGNISTVDYFRSSYSHGTTDSSGIICYDEKGRMVYNDYYITHGRDIKIYLYEEDSNMPWVCFYWCSFGNGFEGIYLFQR